MIGIAIGRVPGPPGPSRLATPMKCSLVTVSDVIIDFVHFFYTGKLLNAFVKLVTETN